VAGKILQELRQNRPFRHLEEELFLNVQRTADVLMQELLDVLKPFGLSVTQYNVLRILRGAGEAGLSCKDIGARLITRDPDITRLLDRLERRHLLTRNRAKQDRRFVSIRITDHGLAVLRELDEPVGQRQVDLMCHIDKAQLPVAIDILEQLRDSPK